MERASEKVPPYRTLKAAVVATPSQNTVEEILCTVSGVMREIPEFVKPNADRRIFTSSGSIVWYVWWLINERRSLPRSVISQTRPIKLFTWRRGGRQTERQMEETVTFRHNIKSSTPFFRLGAVGQILSISVPSVRLMIACKPSSDLQRPDLVC